MMHAFPRFLLALSFFLCGSAAAPAWSDPTDPREGLFSDDWAVIYLAGGKVGYMHSTMTRMGDEIHTRTTTVMKLGRANSPIEIKTVQQTIETIDGRPQSFASKMQAATIETSTSGVIRDGRVVITTAQFGMEQKQDYEFPKSALMTWGMYRETLKRGFEPGTSYAFDLYVPELRLDGAVKATTEVGDVETFVHQGTKLSGQRLTVTMKSPIGEMTVTSWVDKLGKPIKAVMPAAGLGDLTIIASDQATALNDFVPPELFLRTTLKANRKINRSAASRIVYRLTKKNAGAVLTGLPVTDMQRISKESDDSVELVVSRRPHVWVTENPTPLSPEARREYLEANLMINTEDPELIRLAKKAGAGETNPFALADRLRRFVTDYVKHKNLNIGFATASEVARTREGDCSEHGVLLAALGRLNGLPARVAVGVAYVPVFGQASDIFGYHLWTQFYIDGRWVDFDAALRESQCSPARITFATSSLRNTGLADLSLPLLSKIGAIHLEILEVEEVGTGQQ